MKKLITLSLFLIANYALTAQELSSASGKWLAQGWGAGLKFSTNGIGIEVGKRITKDDKLFARLQYTRLSFGLDNYEIPFDGNVVKANIEVALGGASLLFDWHPFKNAFKLVGGLGYLQTSISGGGNLRDSTKIGLIPISPDDLGAINASITPKKISPYIGIGFGRAVPKNRIGFSFELGTYYTGKPDATFKTTNLLEPSSSNEAILQSNVSGYNWLPQISLTLTCKIVK